MATTHGDTVLQQSVTVPVLELLAHGGAAGARALLAYQQEVLRFSTRRLESGAALGLALAQSHDWLEAAQAQQQWLAGAAADYAEEAQRLMQLTAEVATWAARAAGSEAQEAAEAGAAAMGRTADAARSAAAAGADAIASASDAAGEAAARAAEAGERAARRYRRSGD